MEENKLERILDLFNLLHDGTIDKITKENDNFIFQVYVPYISELIEDEAEILKIEFHQLKLLELRKWSSEEVVSKISEIEKAECEISGAKYFDGCVRVYCYSQYFSPGVSLDIIADDFNIYSESGKRLELVKVKEIVNKYWNDK